MAKYRLINKRFRYAINTLCFAAVSLLVFLSIMFLTNTSTIEIRNLDEIKDIEFKNGNIQISQELFDFYPNKLHNPYDFKNQITGLPDNNADKVMTKFGTYRLVIPLTEGEIFGISCDSATYSQRLWIDGVLKLQFGIVGSSAADTQHQTSRNVCYFKVGANDTEIIIQRANFVHSQGGRVQPIIVGNEYNIIYKENIDILRAFVVVGCMLAVALLFFGIFLFFKKRRQFLYFSLCCLTIAIRTLFGPGKFIMLLFPDIFWQISHRVEYVNTYIFVMAMLLYFSRMFNLNKMASRIIVCLLFGMICTVIMPSLWYTAFTPIAIVILGVAAATFFVYLTVNCIKNKSKIKLEHYVIFFGTLILAMLAFVDMIGYNRRTDLNLLQIGMIVFALVNMIALILQFERTEMQLERVQIVEAEINERNKAMELYIRIKANFIENISHELKTPLTVMSSYAGLTQKQIEKNAVDDKTIQHLSVIQVEAVRLGKLIEQMKNTAGIGEIAQNFKGVNLLTIVKSAVDFLEAICKKNNNIVLVVGGEDVYIKADKDAIVQILYNITSNASRFTHSGSITISVAKNDKYAKLIIEDTGVGVSESVKTQIFERGISGDGGSGLGLSICREIVEAHNGIIEVESVVRHGTRILISLPLFVAS